MAKIDIFIECKSCGGSGLYKGMCERDKCAVVCTTCKGTGKQRYIMEYEPFIKRKIRGDVERVFGNTCGFVHGDEDYTEDNGNVIEFSKGGVAYDEWLNGTEPLPMEKLYCPKMWTGQEWNSPTCQKNCRPGRSIYNCPMHKSMGQCWKEYKKARKK